MMVFRREEVNSLHCLSPVSQCLSPAAFTKRLKAEAWPAQGSNPVHPAAGRSWLLRLALTGMSHLGGSRFLTHWVLLLMAQMQILCAPPWALEMSSLLCLEWGRLLHTQTSSLLAHFPEGPNKLIFFPLEMLFVNFSLIFCCLQFTNDLSCSLNGVPGTVSNGNCLKWYPSCSIHLSLALQGDCVLSLGVCFQNWGWW